MSLQEFPYHCFLCDHDRVEKCWQYGGQVFSWDILYLWWRNPRYALAYSLLVAHNLTITLTYSKILFLTILTYYMYSSQQSSLLFPQLALDVQKQGWDRGE